MEVLNFVLESLPAITAFFGIVVTNQAWKKIIKEGKDVKYKYEESVSRESEGGEKITASEGIGIAKEAVEFIQAVEESNILKKIFGLIKRKKDA